MYGAVLSSINLRGYEVDEVKAFLNSFDLKLDDDVEFTIVARMDDEILGTCSVAGKVLKCFAVKEELQGEGLTGKLITEASNYLFEKGIYETFIFTKPKMKHIFVSLGYKVVEEARDVVLLEGGFANIEKYVDNMFKKSGLGDGEKAALVVNCNPFTLGHRYLIERASKESEEVVVFVVQENKSLFPFDVRLSLVEQGTKDLKNVKVLPGGDYIISRATFPNYFLRQEDERLRAYTELDTKIFGRYIAKRFNIKKRYVGSEPYCPVTNSYNNTMLDILPQFGIEVKLIERKEIDCDAISASRVRNLLKKGLINEVEPLVPKTTFEFLMTKEGLEIVEKIKGSDSPH